MKRGEMISRGEGKRRRCLKGLIADANALIRFPDFLQDYDVIKFHHIILIMGSSTSLK